MLTSPASGPLFCDADCERACVQGPDDEHVEPSERQLAYDAEKIAVPVPSSSGDFVLRALAYRERP